MPHRLFEELFKAHSKRRAVERCERVRNAMISGVWGNSNYDDSSEAKGTRNTLLGEIERQFETAVIRIYGFQEQDIDKDNPFFGAMKVPEIDETAVLKEPTARNELMMEIQVDQV